ncbi:MAG: hypothetical protein M3P85_15750 [Actinomycetota bacterium]|nr:hypothetical protein [Actinomycetota bacterium]
MRTVAKASRPAADPPPSLFAALRPGPEPVSGLVATSLPWDAAGTFTNAVLILATGRHILPGLRRVAHRLEPVVELVEPVEPGRDEGGLSDEAAFVP